MVFQYELLKKINNFKQFNKYENLEKIKKIYCYLVFPYIGIGEAMKSKNKWMTKTTPKIYEFKSYNPYVHV